MGFPILVRCHLYTELGPRVWDLVALIFTSLLQGHRDIETLLALIILCEGIHKSLVDFPQRASDVELWYMLCVIAWTSWWTKNLVASNMRCYHTHVTSQLFIHSNYGIRVPDFYVSVYEYALTDINRGKTVVLLYFSSFLPGVGILRLLNPAKEPLRLFKSYLFLSA